MFSHLTPAFSGPLRSQLSTSSEIFVGLYEAIGGTRDVQNEEFNSWICKRTPAGWWGTVEEIGAAAVFLASDEASFVNGHVLAVDGSFSASM